MYFGEYTRPRRPGGPYDNVYFKLLNIFVDGPAVVLGLGAADGPSLQQGLGIRTARIRAYSGAGRIRAYSSAGPMKYAFSNTHCCSPHFLYLYFVKINEIFPIVFAARPASQAYITYTSQIYIRSVKINVIFPIVWYRVHQIRRHICLPQIPPAPLG